MQSVEIDEKFVTFCNVLSPYDLAFTSSEEGCIPAPLMALPTVTERVHRVVARWLREHGRGSQKQLADEVSALLKRRHPGRRRLSPSLISMFKNRERMGAIDLDDLDVLAEAMNCSLSALLGTPQRGDLAPKEQRLLLAVRSLNPEAQDHLLSVAETMSIGTQLAEGRSVGTPQQTRGHDATSPVPSASAAPLDLDRAKRLAVELLDLISEAESRRQTPDLGRDVSGPPSGNRTAS